MTLGLSPHIQVILFVQNMNIEVQFYQDILGLSIRYPQNLNDYSDEMWVEFEVGDSTLALHGGTETQPDDLHEIVFTVDNVARAREMIVAAGIQMDAMRELEDGAPIAEGWDPDGHRFAIRSKKA